MSGEVAAILLLVVVHVVAVGVLVYAMVDGDSGAWRGWWPRDDGPEDPAPEPLRPTPGDLPLPDAEPASVRLRGAGRLARRPPRRREPGHPPRPVRTPERR